MSQITVRQLSVGQREGRTSAYESPATYEVTGGLFGAVVLPDAFLVRANGLAETVYVTHAVLQAWVTAAKELGPRHAEEYHMLFGVTVAPATVRWPHSALPAEFFRPLRISSRAGPVASPLPAEVRPGRVPAPGLDTALSVTERVARAQEWLGLNAKQTAFVLGIDRATLYGWLDGRQPQERHARRVQTLYEVASLWHGHWPGPLSHVLTAPLRDGTTLLARLASRDLSADALAPIFRTVAERLRTGQALSLSPRRRRRAPGTPSREEINQALAAASNDAAYRAEQQALLEEFDWAEAPPESEER